MHRRIFEDGGRQAAPHIACYRASICPEQRPIVLDQAFECFPGQVEPVERCIAVFKLGDDAHCLGIMVETAIRPHRLVEASSPVCPKGVWPRSWPSARGLGQIVIEAKRAGESPGNLANLDRMGESCAVMIALVRNENLRLYGRDGGRPSNAGYGHGHAGIRSVSGNLPREKAGPGFGWRRGVGARHGMKAVDGPSGRGGFGVWRQSRVPFAKLSQGTAAAPASLQMARLRPYLPIATLCKRYDGPPSAVDLRSDERYCRRNTGESHRQRRSPHRRNPEDRAGRFGAAHCRRGWRLLGFQYKYAVVSATADGDLVLAEDGAKVASRPNFAGLSAWQQGSISSMS